MGFLLHPRSLAAEADHCRCHAKNRRRAHPQNQFDFLSAKFTNGERRNRLEARGRLLQQQQLQQGEQSPALDLVVVQEKGVLRQRSALQLFHAECCKDAKVDAQLDDAKVNPATTEFWDVVRRGLNNSLRTTRRNMSPEAKPLAQQRV